MTDPEPSVRRLALLVGLHTSFGRRVLEGVVSYCEREGAATRATWQILSDDWGDVGLEELGTGLVEGVLGTVTDQATLSVIRERGLPCVNVAEHPLGLSLPSVVGDSVETGRVAARHLLERGERTLGFFGRRGDQASEKAFRGFVQSAGGRPLHRHEGRRAWAGRRRQEWEALLHWLEGLPRPAAVFAADDILARRVLQACTQLGLAVPDAVAVLGCGDFSLVNRVATPPLSSVTLSSFEIGYRAAQILDAWLEGEAPPSQPVLVTPAGVVTRRSTDVLSVADPTVQRALAFIQANLGQGLQVGHVAAHAAVSRRWLERKFLDSLGRSPAAEIRRAQVERASRLLVDTDWSLAVIARQCGLRAPERLSVLFKRETGLTPGRYRLGAGGG